MLKGSYAIFLSYIGELHPWRLVSFRLGLRVSGGEFGLRGLQSLAPVLSDGGDLAAPMAPTRPTARLRSLMSELTYLGRHSPTELEGISF
jgi:hypothetical protein